MLLRIPDITRLTGKSVRPHFKLRTGSCGTSKAIRQLNEARVAQLLLISEYNPSEGVKILTTR